MRVHDVIGAFYAIDACRTRAPGLREHYQPGTKERQALDEALAALDRFSAATLENAPQPARPRPHLVEARS
jgi:hypothetical protein